MRIPTILKSTVLAAGLLAASAGGAFAAEPDALVTRAEAALWGIEREVDPAEAADLLEQAVELGDLKAMRLLGQQLVGGWVLEQDTDRGLALLERAIDAGDVKAQLVLGGFLLWGTEIAPDKRRALALFEAAAEQGDASGLVQYGEALMWSLRDPAGAEAMLNRAGEMGESRAWVVLANGAMYGYLGGGNRSRAKFTPYADKARAAGEERIAVLEAERSMWGINMRASGPRTIDILTEAARAGNTEAARRLIRLLRDGNGWYMKRSPDEAATAYEEFAPLLDSDELAPLALTLEIAKANTIEDYPVAANLIAAHPEFNTVAFFTDLYGAHPNVALYILQTRWKEQGHYRGPLNGLATRTTMNAVTAACRRDVASSLCDGPIMRAEVIGVLLMQK